MPHISQFSYLACILRRHLVYGEIPFDLNVDHVAVSNIDARGYRLESFTVPFDLKGKTSGQISVRRHLVYGEIPFVSLRPDGFSHFLVRKRRNFPVPELASVLKPGLGLAASPTAACLLI